MSKKHAPKVVGMIPARYGSIRFPGKPLVNILGKSLIQRTYENAKRCKILDELIVATDDKRIFDHVKGFGGEAVMTSTECATGTDRLAEAVKNSAHLKEVSIILNIQGDEPCLEPEVMDEVVNLLIQDPDAAMSTAVVKIDSEEEACNPSVVKCVMDAKCNALYFSRSLIPADKSLKFRKDLIYYRHLGIYGYKRDFLFHYSQLKPTPLQLAEDLEQLKVLEHGFRVKVAIVKSVGIGVDTPEDIKKVEQLLCKQNTYS